jgi:hypothetical protein
MTEMTTNTPNADSAATVQNAVPSLDSIASKMAAMREQTLRNQIRPTEQTAAGADESADSSSPVAPSDNAEAEVADSSDTEFVSDDQEVAAQEEPVSTNSNDSTADELIDFIEFAETNPNAKFKFMRNGKEVVIDAKKAAAILGQGSAIHEEARQLKIERAEFDEYLKEARARQDGLNLAMEFTVQPKLQKAYDEILKTQNFQTTFQQQLAATQDPAHRARIQASMQQNEQYIRQQQAVISQLQPNVEQFRQIRSQQVVQRLDMARKSFTDKELKNDYVFKEIRDKMSKVWPEAYGEIIPGVANIDLISSDENLLSLVRDGLKYRDKPSSKSAGASMAVLTNRKGSSNSQKGANDNIEKLREQAKSGDRKAADNLLVAQLQRLRQSRGGR